MKQINAAGGLGIMPTSSFPNHGVGSFVLGLALRHGVKRTIGRHDGLARLVTSFAGDDVVIDDVQAVIYDLCRARVVDVKQAVDLQLRYLRERDADGIEGHDESLYCSFDPFGDFETRGYLRNAFVEKRPDLIKASEHMVFALNIEAAIEFLAREEFVAYESFLSVHRMLFSDFYPWAGQDRGLTAPNSMISKGTVEFALPGFSRRAIEDGLRRCESGSVMAEVAGAVMGCFAYGHPFLDGNGRTIFLVHMELCRRRGCSIQWSRVDRDHYLEALTQELAHPDEGVLDFFLRPFLTNRS